MSSAPRRPAAVLWDMDGTLVDTEPYWIAAEYALVERFGGQWTDDLAHELVGNPLLVSADFIRAHSPVTWPSERIVQWLSGEVTAAVRRSVPWRPGALELLTQCCREGVPTALVTMSYGDLAGALLDALPADVSFDVVVTGDRVERGKPDPEAYLLALHELAVPAEQALAIEDSPSGVSAAIAAGLRTLAVPHVVPVPELRGSAQVDSLAGLSLEGLGDLISRLPQPLRR